MYGIRRTSQRMALNGFTLARRMVHDLVRNLRRQLFIVTNAYELKHQVDAAGTTRASDNVAVNRKQLLSQIDIGKLFRKTG